MQELKKFLSVPVTGGVGLALILAMLCVCPAQAQNGHWLTGYYAIYDQNGTMNPNQVDMTKMTHVIYWGVEPTSTGGLNTTKYVSSSTFANGATELVTAAHAAGAKALIGIGGDAYSGYSLAFNQATTPANLPAFVSAIVSLMQQYNFDGVDINWEQIGSYGGDNTQFPAFIKGLRAKLNTLTPTPLLTMSPETEPSGGRPDLIGPIQADFDQINIQTYLMSGPYCGWETWHNSPYSNEGLNFILAATEPLPSVTLAVADYTNAGVPIGKLGMGIQFGGLEWDGGAGTSTGGATKPEQTWTGDANMNFCSTTNPSAPTLNYPLYTSLAPLATGAPANGYTVNYDSVADQSWLSYDPSGTGTTNEANDKFISYDSPTSIAQKGTDLSDGSGLGGSMGGVMLFELSGDYFPAAATDEQHPLLTAANAMQSLLPGMVTNLKITAGSGKANLTWTAAPFTTSYKVYYSTTSGSAGTLSGTVTTTVATLSNLTPGQLYYFQVEPVNSFGPATGGIAKGSATIGGLITPTITWNPNPATIAYGTPLTGAQLDATASVAGTFSYSSKIGSILPVGANTLTVNFTPSIPGYSTTSAKATITVTAATLSTSQNFASVEMGAWSNAHSIQIYYPTPSSPAGSVIIGTLTLGASGLDFHNDSSSCTYNTTAKAENCTVLLTFSPTAAGMRMGAIVMLINKVPVATTYIWGVGYGRQLVFDPGVAKAYTLPAASMPNSVAVDGAGNIDIFDSLTQKVFKFTPAGTEIVLAGPLSAQVEAIALDGGGNLFLVQPTGVLKLNQNEAVSTFATGLTPAPMGIAINNSGVVYVANTQANSVLKYTPAGVVSTVVASTVSIAGTKLKSPAGLAIDVAGNLYIADSGNNRIVKYSSTGTLSVVSLSGVASVGAIAVDGVGNLYLADAVNNRILKLNSTGLQSTVVSGVVLGKTLSPSAIALDGADNLYIAESANQRLLKISRSTPPALSFNSTNVGSISADSPRTITMENVGNLTLSIPAPTAGTNPAISPSFTLAGATTCPVVKAGTTAGSLTAGSICNYAINFAPLEAGSLTGSLILTDNTMNAAGSKQNAALSGTGLTTTAKVTLSNLTATYSGLPIPVTVTTVPADLTVSITYNGTTTAPTKAGSYAVVATVTEAGYTGSATGTEVIAKGTPVVNWPALSAVNAPYALSTTQLDAKATYGTSTVAGTMLYTPPSGTVLSAGTYTLKAQFTPTDTVDFNTPAVAEQTLLVNGPPRVVWIPDYYGKLLQVRVGTLSTAITVALPSACNPNAVAVNSNNAYVVCNSDLGGNDEILVYNAATIRSAPAGALTLSPTQTITSAQFNSLIGITFDASNNLWVASYGNNQVDEITAASLATQTPTATASLIDSPDSPVALAFDPNGGLWVTGQYSGGILLHFPTAQLGQGSNANPDYCLATTNLGGCQFINGVFFGLEGLALFNNEIWVANNSTGETGATPGRELIGLTYTAGTGGAMGTLAVNSTYGNPSTPANSPIVCPGGLFAGTIHLWINDESYAETNAACGASGDVASQTGAVFDYTAAQLAAQPNSASTAELAYKNITGRPGFGGLFVENDQ